MAIQNGSLVMLQLEEFGKLTLKLKKYEEVISKLAMLDTLSFAPAYYPTELVELKKIAKQLLKDK